VLERIKVRGFKSLRDLEVVLAPVVVIFGPNAVGKSNILEALQLLSRLVTQRTLSDAFNKPLRGYPLEAFSIPTGGLPELLSKSTVDLDIEADVTCNGTRLRYSVGVRATPQTGELVVAGEHLARLKADLTPAKQHARIEGDGSHLIVRRMNESGQPRREPIGLNHTLASNLQFSGERYPDFDALRSELSSWHSYYLDPGGTMREPQPPRDVDDIGPHGEQLATFLYRLRSNPRYQKYFAAVQRALHSAIPSIDGLQVDLDERRGTLDIVIHHEGTPFSSRIISEGTLRVLALCAIAANPWPSALVAFEEPENGVHPRRIDVIADLLISMTRSSSNDTPRQVVITTHSPALVSAMLRRSRELPGHVKLLRCIQDGSSTRLAEFQPEEGLFEDQEIRNSLTTNDDGQLVEAMLVRGWLDG
jgi:predicted ATPase